MTPRVHVRWTPLETGETDVRELLPLLGEEERMRHATTPDAATASRFVIGRAALRVLAAEIVDDDVLPADVRISAICDVCGGPHGRPTADLISAKGKRLSVSIAHCAAGVAVAAMWRGPVGIDVELADAPTASLAAVSALIPATARPAGRNWEPIQHWTRVEAVVKADGRGLAVDPAEVIIAMKDGAITASLARKASGEPATADEGPQRYAIADIRLDPDVRASVAIGLKASAKKQPVVPLTSWRRLELDELRQRTHEHKAHVRS